MEKIKYTFYSATFGTVQASFAFWVACGTLKKPICIFVFNPSSIDNTLSPERSPVLSPKGHKLRFYCKANVDRVDTSACCGWHQ